MSKIPMTSGFALIPEGTHVFRIYAADYNEDFGKIEIKLVNAAGMTHVERFTIMKDKDEPNEGALNAFSYFAKTALNDYTLEEVDPAELVEHYICAELIHTVCPSKKDPNKTVTFANTSKLSPAQGFVDPPVARALKLGKEDSGEHAAPQKEGLDLDALLGD